MSSNLGDYLREAFNARPLGMPIPPNWIALGAFGLLGALNPGFWIIGAGLELAYLLGLSHLPRFRALVDGKKLAQANAEAQRRLDAAAAQIDGDRRRRFVDLRNTCVEILSGQSRLDSGLEQLQRDGLDRLLSLHLRLLLTQATMEDLVREAGADPDELRARADALRTELKGDRFGEEHRRSLEGQIDILERRAQTLSEARERLAFSEAELNRIEQQVALIRDQVRFSAAPETIGSEIDRVSNELDETSRWVQDQQTALDLPFPSALEHQ